MKRTIVVGIGIFICYLLQTSVFELLRLADIAPNIMIILVSSAAVMRGQKEGMLVGFFSGLLLDIFYASYLGGFAFLYMLFGFVDGYFHKIYYSEDNFLPLVMIGVNDLVYGLLMYVSGGLLHNHLHILYYLRHIILPEAVYTVAVGLLLYQILLRVNGWLERDERGRADFV